MTGEPLMEADEPPVPPLDEVDVRHRQMTAEFVTSGRSEPHRWLYEAWRAFNADHFGGVLIEPYIVLDTPSKPSIYGQFGAEAGNGGRGQITIRASLLRGTHPHLREASPEVRERFVLDVLLHEMVHQCHHEITGRTDDGHHGHGTGFRDSANEIGGRLGLPPVRTSKRRGRDADLPSASQWPHNVRPAGYYQGYYVPSRGDDLVALAVNSAHRCAEMWETLTPDAFADRDPDVIAAAADALERLAACAAAHTAALHPASHRRAA